jgi:hypothetical protein
VRASRTRSCPCPRPANGRLPAHRGSRGPREPRRFQGRLHARNAARQGTAWVRRRAHVHERARHAQRRGCSSAPCRCIYRWGRGSRGCRGCPGAQWSEPAGARRGGGPRGAVGNQRTSTRGRRVTGSGVAVTRVLPPSPSWLGARGPARSQPAREGGSTQAALPGRGLFGGARTQNRGIIRSKPHRRGPQEEAGSAPGARGLDLQRPRPKLTQERASSPLR